MGSTVSGLADAVLGVVQGVGLSSDTVARYGKCCEAVVEFCSRRGLDALSGSVVEEFVACQQERARRGEIGPDRRNALVKSARLMLGRTIHTALPATACRDVLVWWRRVLVRPAFSGPLT